MELRREAHIRTDTRSYDELVFHGGAWSPRLTSALRTRLVAPLFSSFAQAQPGLLAEGEKAIGTCMQRDVKREQLHLV